VIVMGLGRVVVGGSTGFVGRELVKRLLAEESCEEVVALARKAGQATAPGGALYSVPAVQRGKLRVCSWADEAEWKQALRGANAVVNLSGEPIVSRWTPEMRIKIVNSRVETNRALIEAIEAIESPAERPSVMVATSAVGYYGSKPESGRETFDESSPPGSGFAADVCVRVEESMEALCSARKVILRSGVVLGPGGGSLGIMLPFFKAGLGGPVGSGKQSVSWISIQDLCSLQIRAIEDPTLNGVYNATAPKPVTMGEMCSSLAKSLRRPNLFPVPEFAIRLLYGDGGDIVLQGQRVYPMRALEAGYEFEHDTIDKATDWVASVC